MTVTKGGQGQLSVTNVNPEEVKWDSSDLNILRL